MPMLPCYDELLWERKCAPIRIDAGAFLISPLDVTDYPAIAPLAYRAFQESVDEAPLAVWEEKIQAIIHGTYGRFLADASFKATTSDGALAGMVLVADYAEYRGPVIALIAVDPPCQRQGLARHLVLQTINALAFQGFLACRARVSPGNEPSAKLFHAVAFTPVTEQPFRR